jgi:hypothetical protein
MRLFLSSLLLISLICGCGSRSTKKPALALPSPAVTEPVNSHSLSEVEDRALQRTIEELIKEDGPLDELEGTLVQARVLQRALDQHNLSSRVDAKRFLNLMSTHFRN